MAISFEPAPNTVAAREMYHRIAREQMRPVARKYDEQEHEMPLEFVRFMWAKGRSPPGSFTGPSDGFVQVCVQAEELCWGDAGLYLRIPSPALGGSAVARPWPSPSARLWFARMVTSSTSLTTASR